MKRLIKFFQLPIAEKIVFFQSLYYLVLFRIRLLTTSPQKLFAIVSKRSVGAPISKGASPAPQRIAGIVNSAGRITPCSTCLSKALAGYTLLAKHGHKARLHIGVSKDDDRNLKAHAWLSHNGEVILGSVPDLERFQEFPQDFVKEPS
jgi:Transglutaminase-like superfamily